MIDIRFLRENPDAVRENIRKKFQDEKLPLVDEAIRLDAEKRAAQQECEQLKAARNKLSKANGPLYGQLKKADEAQKAELQKQIEEKRLIDGKMAQLWTILARQNDADLTGGSSWYEKAQNWAKDKGVSDGANPNGIINRAQIVTMLWRAIGQPAAASGASFADVPADSYYAQAVAWAIENGITAGVGNGTFDPDAACTRGQIATFLYRYMK